MGLTTHPPMRVEVKERIELYLRSRSFWVFMGCSRAAFTFIFTTRAITVFVRNSYRDGMKF